jgi:hypothetical protein
MAVGEDEHDERAVGGEAHEFDVADRRLVLGGEHEARPVGQARERGADAVEHGAHVAFVGAERGVDLLAVERRDLADLEDAVDEHPQAQLRGMRPAEICGLSRRPRYSRSCITLRIVAALTFSDMVRVRVREPHGVAGIKVALDHPAEDLPAPVVHLGEGSARGRSSPGFPNGPTN